MIFSASITIDKDTTEADPKTQMLKIARGYVTKVMVRPRAGHRYLANLTVRYHESQIAPSVEGQSLVGDFFPIDWEEYYKIFQPPYELKLTGWNSDDTFSHTFDVAVVILPREAITSLAVPKSIKDLFSIINPVRIFTGGGKEG